MARYIGPECKLCRREGEKLFLKGQRCFSQKCAFERRAYIPGQHGRARQVRADRASDYSKQLRAKQKARRIYGILEKQFRRYFKVALNKRGLTGVNLLQTLELRLDNVVYRMGLADSRQQARQMVTHGHFVVNSRRTDVPSMIIKEGDVITVREGSRKKTFFQELPAFAEAKTCAAWIERDLNTMSGRVLRIPERGEIDGNLNEQLIVEYYSR
ncbi:MAG: 30S ribosomal protein S4 [Anaerolineaceae bacterium]|nr:30S ribosomal protein S4 [Anaerolineaceae bacterium]